MVAAEVKQLASQTTRATDEISQQIAAIQQATTKTVDQIGSVATTARELASTAVNIATAVDGQGAATREISEGIQIAARNTSLTSTVMKSAEDNVGEGKKASLEIAKWTERLATCADELGAKVATFFTEVRAA